MAELVTDSQADITRLPILVTIKCTHKKEKDTEYVSFLKPLFHQTFTLSCIGN